MNNKPLLWLAGEIKTPPFSALARVDAGVLLRRLQKGDLLEMPDSRPMPSIGRNCHELRVRDAQADKIWRIIYRIDADAIVIGEVFAKKTQKVIHRKDTKIRKRSRFERRSKPFLSTKYSVPAGEARAGVEDPAELCSAGGGAQRPP